MHDGTGDQRLSGHINEVFYDRLRERGKQVSYVLLKASRPRQHARQEVA
ncbi:hypothetical protein [Klebsiella pneumoniae IS39]|nr:hypothetical protein [Klebsiella pneumoniae IS39]